MHLCLHPQNILKQVPYQANPTCQLFLLNNIFYVRVTTRGTGGVPEPHPTKLTLQCAYESSVLGMAVQGLDWVYLGHK